LTQTVRRALPYGLSSLSSWLYMRADVVLLGLLLGTIAVGVYNVAYRIVFLLMFVAQFASVSLFPLASTLYKNSAKDLEVLYHKSLNLIILIVFPVVGGLWLVAPDLIRLLFGEEFAESALILRILAGVLFLNFLSRTLGVFLMSCDHEVTRAKIQWTTACVNVSGNLILIPAYGIEGAAVATLISETLLVTLFALQLKGILGWPRIGFRLVIGGMGTASFCLAFTLFPSFSLAVVIPTSLFLYAATLVLFKETRANEVCMFVGMLKRALIPLKLQTQERQNKQKIAGVRSLD
jgi:O-antigen/teichoic acid export membrane protein